jgi:uncharacterized protein YigE (DUF2233 family)
MNRQSIFTKFIALLVFSISSTCFSQWKTLEPGIEYQDLAPIYLNDWSHIHVFKINLAQHQLKIINHNDLNIKFPTIEQYAKHQNAPLAINGGFFDQKDQPLGLRVSDYQPTHAFKNISWWGVFYIQNHHARISSARQFSTKQNIEFAMQAGPRLIIDNHIPSLRPGYAERTAICVLNENEIAMIITQYFPTTLNQFAKLIQDKPLRCQNALNLDGGSSSQFFAKFSGFFLHMPGLAAVSDAIVVLPRSKS